MADSAQTTNESQLNNNTMLAPVMRNPLRNFAAATVTQTRGQVRGNALSQMVRV